MTPSYRTNFRINRTIPVILAGVWLCVITTSKIYDRTSDSQSLRLNIPDSVTTVRGLLIVCNWAGGDVREEATNPEFVAFAERTSFAVLATAYWSNFSSANNAELMQFETMLSSLAMDAKHPEISNAPWMPLGNSNGGQMSYGFAAKRPEKVIAFITSKGCCYNDTRPPEATLAVPGLLIAGEIDTAIRRTNIRNLFAYNRARGALWAWVEEEATAHDDHNGQQLKFAFLAECLRLRYPSEQSPVTGPVILNPLQEENGWLVDHTSWDSGFTRIFPHGEVLSDPLNYGWVPNRKMAMLYRAFSSRSKATEDQSVVPSVVNGLKPTTYAPPLNFGLDWSEAEGFVDGHSLGIVPRGETPSWSVDFQYGGLYVFHTVVLMTNGSERTSYLNRVFVNKPFPSTVFENWLYDSAPPGRQLAYSRVAPDDETMLERFAYGRDLGNQRNPVIGFDIPTTRLVYHLATRTGLPDSGVSVRVEYSPDLKEWTPQEMNREVGDDDGIETLSIGFDANTAKGVFFRTAIEQSIKMPP